MKKIYLFIPLIFFLFIACSVPFIRDVVESILDNEGVLLLNFDSDEVANCTIVPDFDMTIVTYDIRGTGPDSDSFEELDWLTNSPLMVHSLTPGNWLIEVDAKNADGIIIADGSTNVDVVGGAITPATIIITPLEGNGLLTVNIDWNTEDVDDPLIIVTGEVDGYPFDGSNVTYLSSFDVNGTSASSSTILPVGYYRLSMTIIGGENSVYLTNIVVRVIYDQETIADFLVNPDGKTELIITIVDNMQNPINITFNGQQPQLYKGTCMTVIATTDPSPVDSYQWYLDGIIIPGETGSSITIDADDHNIKENYKLTLIVSKSVVLSSEYLYFDIRE